MADEIPQWAKDQKFPIALIEQSYCLSMTGTTVTIECEDADDANELFDWLEEVGPDKPPSEGRLGSACGAVASAVFYHITDHQHREKLAFALVDLAQEIRRGIELGKAGEA